MSGHRCQPYDLDYHDEDEDGAVVCRSCGRTWLRSPQPWRAYWLVGDTAFPDAGERSAAA